jgi:hypothetical protein
VLHIAISVAGLLVFSQILRHALRCEIQVTLFISLMEIKIERDGRASAYLSLLSSLPVTWSTKSNAVSFQAFSCCCCRFHFVVFSMGRGIIRCFSRQRTLLKQKEWKKKSERDGWILSLSLSYCLVRGEERAPSRINKQEKKRKNLGSFCVALKKKFNFFKKRK